MFGLLAHALYALHPFYSLHGLAWGVTEGARKLVATAATPRSRAAKYDSPWYSVSGRIHKRYYIICGSAFPTLYLLPSNSQSYNKLVAKKKSLHSATTTMATAFSLQRLFHLFSSWHDAPEDDKEYECFCIGLCKAEQS